MNITNTVPAITSFETAVITKVRIPQGDSVHDYATYLLLPASAREGDEANAVDQQIARYTLEWLGFTPGDWNYNLSVAGQKANRPDYLIKGSIGTAFIWESKNTTLDLKDEHIEQMRRYSTGTAGYAVWCNMRRLLAIRFNTTDATRYETLADVDLIGLFGSQRMLATEQTEQETQLDLLRLLFSKSRFTQFANLVARVAVDEVHWRSQAQPLDQPEIIRQFITDSRESLGHVRLVALGQIREALARRNVQALEEASLANEWNQARERFIDSLSFEVIRQPVRVVIEQLETKLGELQNQQIKAIWETVEREGNASPGSSLRPNFEAWVDRAVRVNSALLSLRFRRTTMSAISEAHRVWSERQADQNDSQPEVFAEQVAYVFFVRLLLVRVLEDKGVLTPRLASDGGFQEWVDYVKHRFKELDGISILNQSYAQLLTRKAEQYYLHFFQQDVFDWFLPDDFLFVETLEFLCRYDFARVTNDIIGFTYEEYIDRNARNRKGHFLTRDEVVSYMLDLLGYSGSEMIGRSLLDPACGSGSFLVHAARRYRAALVDAACMQAHVANDERLLTPLRRKQLARDFLDGLTTRFYGIELNPFACYLAEMNLLIQSLDDLAVLGQAGETRAIERFNIFNSDSLDLPREVLDSGDIAGNRSLLDVPDRLSDRLFDEAYPLKARLNGFRDGFFYIISNPPYVTTKRESLDLDRLRVSPFYAVALSGDTNLYLLFLRLGLYYLADYGRMLFIQPLTLFGDSSANAARKLLTTAPFAVGAVVRFYRGDVLFPSVDQAVGIVLVQRSVVPTSVLISGGETVAQARAAHSAAQPASVLEAVPNAGLWQGNWLVCDDPAILDVWQHVKAISNDLAFRLKTLLDATFETKQGDVNATYINSLRVGASGSSAQGDVAIYKGENVDPFAPLSFPPSDWAKPLAAQQTASRETSRASLTLTALKQLPTVEYGIVLRETARLNTRERLIATWFERDAAKPIAFTHKLWRMIMRSNAPQHNSKAILAFLNSAIAAYLLNLFSTNNGVVKDEFERLPIPDPATFPAAALAALAEQALATRKELEQQYVQAYQAELPATSSGETYLPPTPVLATWHGPKLTLGALKTRGLVRLLGPETSRIKALRQRDLLRYTGSDLAVAQVISQFLDQPDRSESTWAMAQHWELPDPIAITSWHDYYAALANALESLWKQFNHIQTQIDDAVMNWYNFDSAMRATIRAGLPWARRRVVAPSPALAPMRVSSAIVGSTQRQTVQSRNIEAIGYDPASQILEIEFSNGGIYQYQAVPLLIWQQFEASKSKGAFYNSNIKGKYVGHELT